MSEVLVLYDNLVARVYLHIYTNLDVQEVFKGLGNLNFQC